MVREHSHSRSTLLMLTMCSLEMAYACTAGAQANPAPGTASPTNSAATSDSTEALLEIVVTAQRRSESLKDVPISVQAISGDQLARESVNGTRDLASIAPSLTFSSGNNGGATAFSLRGISSVSLESGVQPSTAMVVDGVPVVRQGEFVSDLGDIDRIEVLNGPQGTLFGKNSTAGVINITTKQPGHAFEGSIDTLATSDSEFGVRGMFNAPVSDAVRVRVNGYYRDQEPLIKNISGPDVAGEKSYGFRAKVEFDFTPNTTLQLQAGYSHNDSSFGALIPIGPSPLFPAAQLAAIGVPVKFGATTINQNSGTQDLTDHKSVSGTLTWQATEHLSVVSISNYTRFLERSIVDEDGTSAGVLIGSTAVQPFPNYPVLSVDTGVNSYKNQYEYYSEELRANYADGPIKAVAGAYFQHLNQFTELNTPFIFNGALLGLSPTEQFFESPQFDARIGDQTASVFGDVTYEIVDHVKIFGGARYTYERLTEKYHRDDYLNPVSQFDPLTGINAAAPVDTVNVSAATKVWNTSGRLGLQYEPTQDSNIYVSGARGFKSPAADASQGLAHGSNPLIEPEFATSVEIGAKLRLFEHRLAVNAAVFHETVENIQENIVLPANLISPQLVNAGKLRTVGFEGDMQWAVTTPLRLEASLVYDHAYYLGYPFQCTYTQSKTGTCPNSPIPGFGSIRGQQAVGAPKWKYRLGADYESPLPGTRLRVYGGINWIWTDSIQYQLGDDPLTREPSHGMLNAQLGFKGPADHWELELFGKNLTNRFYYSNRIGGALIIGEPIAFVPRDFHIYGGARLTYRF